jgi:hypothetical protein
LVIEHAKKLGIPGQLPNWAKIHQSFSGTQFKPVAVRGYVGAAPYSYMIAHGQFPVSAYWVQRYRISPSFVVPTDAFHDLGHGLAMAMPDYRQYLQRFARASLKLGGGICSRRLHEQFVKYFELCYCKTASGQIEPIGPGMISLDNAHLTAKGLKLIWYGEGNPGVYNQKHSHAPFEFGSRAEWRKRTERFLRDLEKKAAGP